MLQALWEGGASWSRVFLFAQYRWVGLLTPVTYGGVRNLSRSSCWHGALKRLGLGSFLLPFTVVLDDECVTVPSEYVVLPGLDHPRTPSYMITASCWERQLVPRSSSVVDQNTEVWVEIGADVVYRVIVGGCVRVDDEFVDFEVHGCLNVPGATDWSYLGAYGLLRVPREFIKPSLALSCQSTNGTDILYSRRDRGSWRVHRECTLVYPPGYASWSSIYCEQLALDPEDRAPATDSPMISFASFWEEDEDVSHSSTRTSLHATQSWRGSQKRWKSRFSRVTHSLACRASRVAGDTGLEESTDVDGVV